MQENNISSAPAAANGIDQAQFEADKRAVYKHPLFSLLALLLEKCEQATQGYVPSSSSNSSASSPNGTSNSNGEGDSFSRDIQAFVQLLEKEKRPLLTNNAELDGLMIKALQVLRIHLLELEKVQELCRDFCTRYIACLRGKMQSENLLRSDYPLENNNNLSNSNSPINSPDQHEQVTGQTSGYFGSSDYIPSAEGSDYNNLPGAYNLSSNNQITERSFNSSPNELNTNGNGIQLTGLPNQPHQPANIPAHQPSIGAAVTATAAAVNALNSSQILGSTPLSQIGCPPLNLDQYSGQLSPCGSSDDIDSELDSNNDDLSSNFSNNSGSKRQKRGILPKQATSVMRAWLFQHLVHPYPTEDEKRAIAAQTNLTLLQSLTSYRKRSQTKRDYFLYGALVGSTSAVRDLGIVSDSELNFYNNIVSRENSALGFVKRWTKEFQDPFVTRSLYMTLLRPILEYVSELWSPYPAVYGILIVLRLYKEDLFVLRQSSWVDSSQLQPYAERLKLIQLQTLLRRRVVGDILFAHQVLEVNNWFINARRRILQPMLEHATDNGPNQVRKKPSQGNSPSKRFWPENLAVQNNINPSMIDPNIENISANVNRAEIERLPSQKLAENFYSSDESNDSLVIDQEC